MVVKTGNQGQRKVALFGSGRWPHPTPFWSEAGPPQRFLKSGIAGKEGRVEEAGKNGSRHVAHVSAYQSGHGFAPDQRSDCVVRGDLFDHGPGHQRIAIGSV